jgi:uncharacterized protein (DUF305 family)
MEAQIAHTDSFSAEAAQATGGRARKLPLLSAAMRRPATPLIVLAVMALITGCGGDDGGSDISRVRANETDMAFVTQTIPHHEAAVDAADLAASRADTGELRRLARELLQVQSTELGSMRIVRRVLADAGVEEGDLGLEEGAFQATIDPEPLRDARDFDRAYVDAMIPHHELMIAMARAERRQGVHAELRLTARDVADFAEFQADRMRRLRERLGER